MLATSAPRRRPFFVLSGQRVKRTCVRAAALSVLPCSWAANSSHRFTEASARLCEQRDIWPSPMLYQSKCILLACSGSARALAATANAYKTRQSRATLRLMSTRAQPYARALWCTILKVDVLHARARARVFGLAEFHVEQRYIPYLLGLGLSWLRTRCRAPWPVLLELLGVPRIALRG